jgi:hypothetical protein
VNGGCQGVCMAGYANCNSTLQANGCNIDTNNDPANCGTCGHLCPPSMGGMGPPLCGGAGMCLP